MAEMAVIGHTHALAFLALCPTSEHDALDGLIPHPLLRHVFVLFARISSAWQCGHSTVVADCQALAGVMALVCASEDDLGAFEVPPLGLGT